jgi:hypothetical protein
MVDWVGRWSPASGAQRQATRCAVSASRRSPTAQRSDRAVKADHVLPCLKRDLLFFSCFFILMNLLRTFSPLENSFVFLLMKHRRVREKN